MKCPVCLRQDAIHRGTLSGAATGQPASEGEVVEVGCVQSCGDYKYTAASFQPLNAVHPDQRPLLSCWIWEQNRSGIEPTVTSSNITTVLSSSPLKFVEKVKRLLIYAADQSTWGRAIPTDNQTIYAMLQTNKLAEVQLIVRYLEENRYVSNTMGGNQVQVTGNGFMKADEWRQSDVQSSQGFVAMWFDASMDSAWENGFEVGIRNAGYKALRISKKDFVGGITDEIMSEIRRSKFVIADYTGQNNGVYFEVGFALGLGLTVIPTCRSDELGKLHFDIKHLNTLPWDSPVELAENLARRIRAVVGGGPDDAPLRKESG